MSYWVYLTIDAGGDEDVTVSEAGNMTSNVAPMWTEALGFYLLDMEGWEGSKCIPHLERGIAKMADPETRHEYTAMNPENGWGSVETAEQYLKDVLAACREAPKGKMVISR